MIDWQKSMLLIIEKLNEPMKESSVMSYGTREGQPKGYAEIQRIPQYDGVDRPQIHAWIDRGYYNVGIYPSVLKEIEKATGLSCYYIAWEERKLHIFFEELSE